MNSIVDIDSNIIEDCIKDYYSNKEFRTSSMRKANPKVHIDYFTDIASKTLKSKVSFVSGNYYRHNLPYMPHTDYKEELNNTINFVIPLTIEKEAWLIIFDQVWSRDSVTWDMDLNIEELKTNTNVKGYPTDHDIEGLTDKPFDKDFHEKYISYFNIDRLYGMTAEAFNFIPSKAVIFDNRKIHCTSHGIWKKLGLSLRFKYD
jgi:hypothetical protein